MYLRIYVLCFTALLPTTPINIRLPVENITDVLFIVQWDKVINQSVSGYKVIWTDESNSTQTVTVNETSYTVTGLTPNTTYTVNVAAINKCGTGPLSTDKRVTTNVSFSMNTISTSTIINPSITTSTINFKLVTRNVTTINSVINLLPTMQTTNPPNATSKFPKCMVLTQKLS